MLNIVGIIALAAGGWMVYQQPTSFIGTAGILVFCGLALAVLPSRSNKQHR